jgi:hypothetical protein
MPLLQDIFETSLAPDISVSAQSRINNKIRSGSQTPIALEVTDWDTNNFHYKTAYDSGIATPTGSPTNLQDITKTTWVVDEFINMILYITGGVGIGQARVINSNTVNTIEIVGSWDEIPDATSTYEITINNRLTINPNQEGKYLISSRITYEGNIAGERGIAIIKGDLLGNFTLLHRGFDLPINALDSRSSIQTVVADLIAGDWIEMRGFQNTGAYISTRGAIQINNVLLQLTKQRGLT